MDHEELINLLSNGNKEETKKAISYIEKLPKLIKGRSAQYRKLLFWTFQHFFEVKNPANRVAILHGLKLPFMYLGSKYYDSCSKFLLLILHDPDGRVREQGYHAADWFLMDITPDSPYKNKRERDYEKQAKQFIDFVIRLDQVAKEHKREAKGLQYLNDMKPCPYKTLQKFLRRILTNEWYMKTIHKSGYVEYPADKDIFSETYSEFWEVAPHLELHEVEFTMELKKGKKLMTKPKTGYQFKVTLHKNKEIYRIIEISPKLSLYSLAEAIVDSFDFDLDHCFGYFNQIDGRSFLYNSTEKYELFNDLPDVEPTDAGSVKNTKIEDVWTHMRKVMYFLFDYGDNWLFDVDLVDININSKLTPRHFYDISEEVGKSPEQHPNNK